MTDATTTPSRVRIPHLQDWKQQAKKWSMLTAYDTLTAQVFEEAGIPALLVGDSAANTVYGYDSTLPVSVEELLFLVRGVTRGVRRPLVVADLPFGSYQESPEQAFATATRFMKEGGAHAVKIEGGTEISAQVKKLAANGIPVMAHLGFTPQSEHQLGGYRVQGRDGSAQELIDAALSLEEAGAFAVVLEMVPGAVARDVTSELSIPTVGIGAGVDCDAQVLVWQDMAGLTSGKGPRFVRRYADLRGELTRAARDFAQDVEQASFPAAEHTF